MQNVVSEVMVRPGSGLGPAWVQPGSGLGPAWVRHGSSMAPTCDHVHMTPQIQHVLLQLQVQRHVLHAPMPARPSHSIHHTGTGMQGGLHYIQAHHQVTAAGLQRQGGQVRLSG